MRGAESDLRKYPLKTTSFGVLTNYCSILDIITTMKSTKVDLSASMRDMAKQHFSYMTDELR
jgi:hypothetical protein